MALSENHKRAVGSSLLLAEIKLIELENLIAHIPEASMYMVQDDLTEEQKKIVLTAIKDMKLQISILHQKYDLRKEINPLSQFLRSANAQLWEVLCDTQINKLKGYGKFAEEENPEELQKDVEGLLGLLTKWK